jgi:hypothetical protein
MKKTLILLVAVMLLSSTVGCGCMRRVRDRLCRGAYCGSSAPVMGATTVPAPAPIYIPQASAPMMQYPQYVMPSTPCETCYPCDPCDPCGGSGTSYDSGWNNDCGCNGGGYLPAGSISAGEYGAPLTAPANPSGPFPSPQ